MDYLENWRADLEGDWEEKLWLAINARDKNQVKKLLDESEYTAPSEVVVGYTLVAKAIDLNDLESLRFLLNLGIYPSIVGPKYDGLSVLMYASMVGNFEAVKILFEAGAKTYVTDSDGNTALSMAAQHSHPEIVAYLSPFYLSEEVRCAEMILHSGMANKSLKFYFESVYSSDYQAVKIAIFEGFDVNSLSEEGKTALHIAAWRGDLEMIETLLQAGVDLEIRDKSNKWTPLMEASSSLHYKVVAQLIHAGANFKAHTKDKVANCLILAIANFYEKSNELCFDFRSSEIALQYQLLETVQMLNYLGIDINKQDKFGNTALSIAIEKELPLIVDFIQHHKKSNKGLYRGRSFKAIMEDNFDEVFRFLPSRIDINSINYQGNTALVLGIEKQNITFIQALLKAGADPNINRSIALFSAIEVGNPEIIKILIQAGVNVNATDGYTTPLIAALRSKQEEIAKLLIYAGASVAIKEPCSNWTPIEYVDYCCPNIISFIQNTDDSDDTLSF